MDFYQELKNDIEKFGVEVSDPVIKDDELDSLMISLDNKVIINIFSKNKIIDFKVNYDGGLKPAQFAEIINSINEFKFKFEKDEARKSAIKQVTDMINRADTKTNDKLEVSVKQEANEPLTIVVK